MPQASAQRRKMKKENRLPIVSEESKPAKTENARSVEPLDLEYLETLERALEEWSGENDDIAYRNL
jgi:hypothetical protein